VGLSVDEAISLAHALIIAANREPGISYHGDVTEFKSHLAWPEESGVE
jgi:hypothetical protein